MCINSGESSKSRHFVGQRQKRQKVFAQLTGEDFITRRFNSLCGGGDAIENVWCESSGHNWTVEVNNYERVNSWLRWKRNWSNLKSSFPSLPSTRDSAKMYLLVAKEMWNGKRKKEQSGSERCGRLGFKHNTHLNLFHLVSLSLFTSSFRLSEISFLFFIPPQNNISFCFNLVDSVALEFGGNLLFIGLLE